MAQQLSARPRYKRILLKLSGEALMGSEEFGIDPKVLDRMALKSASWSGSACRSAWSSAAALFRGAALHGRPAHGDAGHRDERPGDARCAGALEHPGW